MSSRIVEKHPFEPFVPDKMKCVILGSFPGKEHTRGSLPEDAWFYGAPLNQLWRILEIVYLCELRSKQAKQALFTKAGIGIADIFISVIRRNGSNLDDNLEIVEYNQEKIDVILQKFKPQVFCTSRFVEKEFRKMFPAYKAVDILPSPSPRYFKLTVAQKAEIYKSKLPALSKS